MHFQPFSLDSKLELKNRIVLAPHAQELEQAGIDCLDVSAGAPDSPPGSSHPGKGRPLIADPDWPNKLAAGRDDDVVPCLWDNAGCLASSIQLGKPIRCVQNPRVGREHEPEDTTSAPSR